MNGDPAGPIVLGSSPIKVTQETVRLLKVPCPACEKPLNVTMIEPGALIECPDCHNKTWVPTYVPKWWHKTRHFIASLVVSIIVGYLAHIITLWLMDIIHNLKAPL